MIKTLLKIFTFFIVILIFDFSILIYTASASLIVKTPSSLGLSSGLVGYWPMDGADISGTNLTDKSGLGNTGTITGATKVIGKLGQALSFNGTSDYVGIAQNAVLKPTTAVSFGGWFKHNGMVQEVTCMNWDAGSSNPYELLIDNSGSEGYKINVVNSNNGVMWQADVDTNWHHIIGVYDGANTSLKIYVDGVLRDTNPNVISSLTYASYGTQQLLLGYDPENGYCGATMDDIRVYSRALSASEVKRLYNIGAATKINTSPTNSLTFGLVGYWTFDGNKISGTNALDSSGLGNTGTITGATKVIGKLGQALNINGTSGNVWASQSSITSYPFTLSVWAKTTSQASQTAISYASSASNVIFYGVGLDGGKAYIYSRASGPEEDYNQGITNTFANGDWVHIVGVFNSSTDKRVYINGQQEVLLNTSISFSQPNRVGIGYMARSSAFDYWDGSLDDARIYNRALSVSEIRQLYNQGVATKVNTSPVNSLTSGLVGYWTFDGSKISGTNALDSSGNGKTGIISNVIKVIGRLGQALNFNEVGAVTVGTASSFNSYPLSISAWIKTSSDYSRFYLSPPYLPTSYGIVNKYGSYNGYYLYIYDGHLRAWYFKDSSNYIWDGDKGMDGGLIINGWHFVAMTVDSSGGKLFVDGEQRISRGWNGTPSVTTTSNDLVIGGISSFPGIIDDVRIYNRALSTTEIRQLYQMGK